LKGFLYWLKDRLRRGLPLDLDDGGFGKEQLTKCVAEYKSEVEKKEDDLKAKVPDKFQPHSLRGWNTFTRELHKYLSSIKGVTGVPLVYVIRKDPPDPSVAVSTDPKHILIAQAPLRGTAYTKDRQKVYSIISDAVSGTDGWTWIRDIKDEDGRAAMLKLRDHYDGAGSRTRRVQDAKERLKTCHYKSEMSFTFDKYVSSLKDCFDTLQEDEHLITKRDKIDYLLDGIRCAQLTSAISHVSMNPNLQMTFEEAANTMQREVHHIFPFSNPRGKRGISQVNVAVEGEEQETRLVRSARRNNSIRGRSNCGRGWGRNGRGGQSTDTERVVVNGVDITDATRTFSSQEWARLRGHYDLVQQRRDLAHANGRAPGWGQWRGGGTAGRGRGRSNTQDFSMRSIQALQQAQSIISEITSTLNAQEQESHTDDNNNNNTGNSFGVASYGGRQTRFEHPGGRGPRSISKISSQPRRSIKAAHSHRTEELTIVEAMTEIDSHADTCCLGTNFVPLYFTGKICDVTSFLDDLPATTDVKICSGATAYDDANGNTIILIVNEALWMGNKLQHSLLNPYQIRANGVNLCDDLTDMRRFFGIQTDGTQINFQMNGTTCLFNTRTPTTWELDNCQHVKLTSDTEWLPHDDHFGPGITTPTTAPYPSLAAAYDTHHRRTGIDPSVLSRQWGIGLETARNTLWATTQLGIRHALHPITRRYHTDYMALRHR